MHLMIQPVIAESILCDDVLTGQGLLARTLLAWPSSTIGRRPYIEADLSADESLARYRRHLSALLDREPVLRAGTANELEPRALTLTADAKRTWIAVHDAIEADQQDGGAVPPFYHPSRGARVRYRLADLAAFIELQRHW